MFLNKVIYPTEVPADDAVPGRVVLLVHLLLDVGGDVLFHVKFLQGRSGAIHSVLGGRGDVDMETNEENSNF